MTKLQKLRMSYAEIKSAYDLQKYGLTLAEYRMIPYIAIELRDKGKVCSYMSESISKYFERFGCNVTKNRFNQNVIVNE